MLPFSTKLDVMVFGGPSFFRLNQDTVSDVTFGENGGDFSKVVATPTRITRAKSVTGFNAGVDATYIVWSNDSVRLGAGGFVRFTQASTDVEMLKATARSRPTSAASSSGSAAASASKSPLGASLLALLTAVSIWLSPARSQFTAAIQHVSPHFLPSGFSALLVVGGGRRCAPRQAASRTRVAARDQPGAVAAIFSRRPAAVVRDVGRPDRRHRLALRHRRHDRRAPAIDAETVVRPGGRALDRGRDA